LTNHLKFGSASIAAIYKDHWQIELFFKALKQNLKVKTFVGTSENALYSQIWTALIAMVLIKFILFNSRLGRPCQIWWRCCGGHCLRIVHLGLGSIHLFMFPPLDQNHYSCCCPYGAWDNMLQYKEGNLILRSTSTPSTIHWHTYMSSSGMGCQV
jgi:hypothetical protein